MPRAASPRSGRRPGRARATATLTSALASVASSASSSASAFLIAAFAASRAAISAFNSFGRLEEDLRGDDLPLDFTREPLDLDVPALDLGLVLAQDRPGPRRAVPWPP